MKVIKVVEERNGKLISIFATGKWKKKYAEGVETKPDIGYLFAFPSTHLREARESCGGSDSQYWLAEAEVVGKIHFSNIGVVSYHWLRFWKGFNLQLRIPRAEFLLCSSITLIRKLE